MPNKYYNDMTKGTGKTEGIKSKGKTDPKGDPKFVAAPDNTKKSGMGFGNGAKNGGRGSANRA